MLVLTLKDDEAILLSGNIRVVVLSSARNRVKLGIQAPKDVNIVREPILGL